MTQSTVSRDLRRIGAVRVVNSNDETIYVLPEDHQALPPTVSHTLDGLLIEIESNETMVVMHTTPGSAPLVARHLDSMADSLGILGTIAGDDTIFIVPASIKKVSSVVKKLKEEFY